VKYVATGTGYTGSRVLAGVPADLACGFSRTPVPLGEHRVFALNLDQPAAALPQFEDGFSLLYTVAPRADSDGDSRLSRLLAMGKARPARIVYLSSSGVYGDCAGALVDEFQAPNPATKRAIRRLAAEEMLREWCAGHAAELLVFRVAAIYGPGRLGLKRIQNGEAVIREAEAGPGNRIHVEDLADCCLAAITGLVAPGTYNIADGDFRSSSWFLLTVAKLAGLPPPPQVTFAEAERTFPEMRLSFLRESRKIDNAKILRQLAGSLRYADAEDGIRASLGAEAGGTSN
jgi:nucleoside-diphosphate-sugar epimerase